MGRLVDERGLEALRADLAAAEKRLEFLDALEACGVDNWEGYALAQEAISEGAI